MSLARKEIFEFGEFRLDVSEHTIERIDGAQNGTLTEKAFQALVLLVRRRGHLVSKDELIQFIWPDTIVEENNLEKCIHHLRHFLGETPVGTGYIETIRKHGYRFVGNVQAIEVSGSWIPETFRFADEKNGSSVLGADQLITPEEIIETGLLDSQRDLSGAEADDKYFGPTSGIYFERHNLPTPLTELIGRETEVIELKTLLQKATVRLVTLTGTGGTGKTRLGLQVSAQLLSAFPDGVFLVELAAVREPAFILSTIARTLKIEESGSLALESLKMSLRGRCTLIVLDNFEQLLEASPLVAELLEACPQVKVLATSRGALRIRGEYEYPVLPLALPSSNALSPGEALQFSAVKLFVERAVQANCRFSITEDNAPTIVEICRRLDGLPLAIELAAVRTRTMAPEEVLSRLANLLHLLCEGARDLPARQQTMRAAIAWSYKLLSEGEKGLFRRLAVFAGDFTIEAAEHVAGEREEIPRSHAGRQKSSAGKPVVHSCNISSLQIDVADGIASLADKGLLVTSEKSDGHSRFRMLEVVREFALETLEASDEAGPVMRRHAEYYATLGERAEPHMRTSTAGPWLNTLACDHHNLRSAIGWLFENDPVRAAHLAAAIRVYLIVHSHLAEGHEWVETALERNNKLPPAVRSNLMNNLGWITLLRGDYDAARTAFEENLSEAKLSGDKVQIADSLRGLGEAAIPQREYPAARRSLEEALAIYRELDNKLGIANTLCGLGAIVYFQGDVGHSRTLSEEGLKVFRKTGYTSGLCTCLVGLGEFACRRKDYESAQKFFAESFVIAEREGYRDRLSFCLNGFAALAAEHEQWKKAAKLAGAAEKLREMIGFRPSPQDDDFQSFYLAKCLSMLGPELYSAAYDDGRKMRIQDAVALASGLTSWKEDDKCPRSAGDNFAHE